MMPKIPSYRLHKATGRAVVWINRRDIYLGKHGSRESREEYDRVIAEWLANGRYLRADPRDITVVELIARFCEHAEAHYRKPDGSATSTLWNYRSALRPLKELYGSIRVVAFGPRSLKAVRQRMVDSGWVRRSVNQGINLVRGVFRWGVAEELIPVETHTALLTVAPLRQGRSEAPDREAVKPVPDAHIQAIQGHVSCQVWGLIQLQLLCGARGSELVGLKSMNLNTTGLTWTAEITDHKKRYAGRNRELYFGPRSQAILRPFMADRPIDACLFSPRETVAEQHRAAATHKRPGQPQPPRKTARAVGDDTRLRPTGGR